MGSSLKSVMLTISIIAMMMTFVLGQVAPALAQTIPGMGKLVKRDFSSTGNQHLTASSGNNAVCGDHLCMPGEWTKLQESLNKAQISHSAINSTKTMSMSSNSTKTMSMSSNSTKTPSPLVPVPISTPSLTPSFVCTAVKAALGNSTISPSVTAKVLSDLGCNV